MLSKMQVGSRLGVLVDSSSYLHLYIDGQDEYVVEEPVTPSSFAVFDICNTVTKMDSKHEASCPLCRGFIIEQSDESYCKMAQSHERECAVCTTDFTTPKILPCGHLMCRECVISWMDSKPQPGCPLCRCPIGGQSDASTSETVDALPTDVVMEALVESARVLSKDHLCCVCEDVRADFICMQCQDMMCSSCTKAHNKFSRTRSHEVESLSTVTPERLAASRPALCADHGDKHAEIFCVDHGLAVCASCTVTRHRKCKAVRELQTEMTSSESALAILRCKVDNAELNLEEAIAKLDRRLQEVGDNEQNDMAQVDIQCERLHRVVDDFFNTLKERTRDSHSQIRKSLRDAKNVLAEQQVKVTSHKRMLTRASTVAPRPGLIFATKALTDRVNGLDINVQLAGDVLRNPSTNAGFCESVVSRIERELRELIDARAKSEAMSSSGAEVPTRSKAETEKGYKLYISQLGQVTSCEPLEENVLYQLRMDQSKWKSTEPGSVQFGVIEEHSRECNFHTVFSQSRWNEISCEGSVAGLMIDSYNYLHFYLDGRVIDTETRPVSRPCYALFKLNTRMKVTLLHPILKIITKDQGEPSENKTIHRN